MDKHYKSNFYTIKISDKTGGIEITGEHYIRAMSEKAAIDKIKKMEKGKEGCIKVYWDTLKLDDKNNK